jgi:hypothetical protein
MGRSVNFCGIARKMDKFICEPYEKVHFTQVIDIHAIFTVQYSCSLCWYRTHYFLTLHTAHCQFFMPRTVRNVFLNFHQTEQAISDKNNLYFLHCYKVRKK